MNKCKIAIASILTIALILGLLPGGILVVPSEAAEYGLSNPRIDESGLVTWDCVYFGNYWKSEYEPIQEPDNPSDGTVYTDTDGTEFIYDNDRFNKKAANDKYFKKEPIKWRVLSVDGNDAFLLADQNLDYRFYDNLNATWENCKMRKWLNEDFYNNAFTDEEKNTILIAEVENWDNPPFGTGGVTTSDKVFLLSLDEVTNPSYGFPTEYSATETRVAKNTEYVASYGYTSPAGESDNWWLRTPCISLNFIMIADRDGIVNNDYLAAGRRTVRPVLHLNLSSSVWSKADTVSAEGGTLPTPTPTADNTTRPTVPTPPTPPTSQGVVRPTPTINPLSVSTATPTPKPQTVTAPGKVQKLTAKNSKKKTVTVTWKKVSDATGYQIQYSANKAFKKVVSKTTTKTKVIVKKLKKKKTYSFRVRAYKTSDGKKVYGDWCKAKNVKIKK